MSAHSCRVFLNSCVKVPIDPCNNCPAPIYNRPKMYLGRLTTTPMTASTKFTSTDTCLKATDVETEALWTCSGIRSLAKLYDSIPDYCDINHLPEEDFYSTLDTLRTTCRELRSKPTKPLHSSGLAAECNSSSSCVSSRNAHRVGGKTKHTKKKKSTSVKSGSKKKSVALKKNEENKFELGCIAEVACSKDNAERVRLQGYKQEFEEEVEAFQQTLKDFEAELERPTSTVAASRPKSTSARATNKSLITSRECCEDEGKNSARAPIKCVPTSARHKFLRKSFSFNDISVISDSQQNENKLDRNKNSERLTRTEPLAFRDRTKLSNYFSEKSNKAKTGTSNRQIPKIVVASPNSETTSMSTRLSSTSLDRCKGGRGKQMKSKHCQEDLKPPFTLFTFEENKKDIAKLSTPSPMHPVARPNLAATLRAEVSKQKLKELQNNCVYHDTTPQFDWEVRKTPAWKTLTLNETHKEILALRLATRKAEQALQQREYALNIELMRQRVKSAPLLMEGATYWGPHVGKLTHTCQIEGVKHACESNQRKQRKRSSCPSSNSNRRRGVVSSERAAIATVGNSGRASSKLNTMRKVYTNSAACARNEHYTTLSRRRDEKHKHQSGAATNANDSGDDLSSVDRAYL